MVVYVYKCRSCKKKLYRTDDLCIHKYISPIKKCPKCGELYADIRCREMALDGFPEENLRYRGYIILSLFGVFVLYRGIKLFGMYTLGLPDNAQWFLPSVVTLVGLCIVVGGIAEIISISTGHKRKKYEKLMEESEDRMSDAAYAALLNSLGYK